MADLNCDIKIPEQKSLDADDLTVGRTFLLQCHGSWPAGLDPQKVIPELAAPEKYRLKFLKGALTSDGAQFEVTSYQPGPANFQKLVLKDGGKQVELGPIQFKVRSVLDPKQQPPPEPYGAFGPFAMGVPWTWWAALGVIVAIVLTILGLKLRKVLQRRSVLKKLAEYDSPLSPSAEFHAKMRKLQRENVVFAGGSSTVAENQRLVSELDRYFRIFLMRRFRAPALQWGDRALLAEFNRVHGESFEEFVPTLRKFLKELSSARLAAQLQAVDLIQLADGALGLVERLDRQMALRERAPEKR